ncbi:GNAT family N-acetyltransferase [Algibacter amylolyticus]|uniref:GNAT family N-acetyltransferase n=1 Tax=Algibacter amylolyticus TaxID=1608400 RepID=A0A5M7BD98_9FLAO|nr:GNAT family N-acetyltransferase [Algibacter amylolyticus]KAA5827462.1 GNAT family N-acetyltransferase [Algibacter amylolyticus]MBB5266659.1 ElaA protein [Algibacter amylolyticus]TSJ81707.1 GNAT family N-acetyltransferase [Algibacter amylolyticus]
MLNIKVKSFNELSRHELYYLLQLRSEVFVVEQDCIYQDIDGKDQKSLHVLGVKNDKIVAYTRIFKPGDYFELASIGRVVVAKNEREHMYGYDIMNASAEAIKTYFNETTIKISAQVYLLKFYNNLGFKETGEEYLEDNIPHIAMIKG